METAAGRYPIIDVHAHPVSRAQVCDSRNLQFMTERAECLVPENAAEHLLARMDLAGVQKTCLMGPAHSEGISCTNEGVRALVEAHPDRFIGFVGVDPFREDADLVQQMIHTAIRDWKFKGVGEFFGDLLDPRCETVYRACINLQVPLLVHAGVPLPSQLLKHGHPNAVDEIANRYPELTIIAAHVGMPWFAETVAVATRHPNVYLDISALPAAPGNIVMGVLALCFKVGLEDRLLFGSDFPVVDPARYLKRLQHGGARQRMMRFLGIPTLTAERRFKLLSGNASKLLKEPETPV